jgi:hypothetical protein
MNAWARTTCPPYVANLGPVMVNGKHLRRCSRALVFLSAMALAFVVDTGQAGSNESLEPATLLQLIKTKGPKAVWNNDLTHENKLALLKNVETGKEPWLQVAVAIFPGADGGDATSIVLAASSALEHSPRAVLLTVAPKLGMEGICDYSELTMSWRKLSQRKAVIADIDARIRAVRKLTGSDVDTSRDQCLKILEDSKRNMLSPAVGEAE